MSLWLEPAVFPVVLDRCVLYPYTLRDLLLEAANFHLYRVHWSAKVLETPSSTWWRIGGLLMCSRLRRQFHTGL